VDRRLPQAGYLCHRHGSAERRQAIHAELDAGVLEAVQMLRGLVADPEAPAGARVRPATALMDRTRAHACLCG
jgi:hypothetical protein